MCYKYINIHIKCNVSSTCNILNVRILCLRICGRIGAIILLSKKNCGIPYSFLPSLFKKANISKIPLLS
jgi:hypothetical protein